MNNVFLRPLELNDYHILHIWRKKENIFNFLGGGFNPISLKEMKSLMPNMVNAKNSKRFIIELIDEKKPIGFIGIYDMSIKDKTCELGMYIGEEDYQGKGLASEAYDLLEQYLKKHLIRKIKLKVVEENTKARKLYEKKGFYYCGKYIKDRLIKDNFHNVLLMEKFI